MKKGTIYYLKNRQRILITSKPENTKAVIDYIDDDSNLIYGHYVDDTERTFICCKHNFSKIFSSKPSLNDR
jgi:CRISPR/Cas system-associated exonuclease Cas4 (RecB family)